MSDAGKTVVRFDKHDMTSSDRALADVYVDDGYVGYLSIADPADMDDVLTALADGTIVVGGQERL